VSFYSQGEKEGDAYPAKDPPSLIPPPTSEKASSGGGGSKHVLFLERGGEKGKWGAKLFYLRKGGKGRVSKSPPSFKEKRGGRTLLLDKRRILLSEGERGEGREGKTFLRSDCLNPRK